ncbi:class II aldolase/adducin domain-containing protein [Cyathus striatus]|nr:class II aldolase/adducin domain-containing protein [Cyathus striatus]
MWASFPKIPTFSDPYKEREWRKFRLAQAFRIFGARSFDVGPAGHIAVRDTLDSNSFWINPLGIPFKLIQPEDLLLVNSVGHIQPESGPRRSLNAAAFMIHKHIHDARPDVLCSAHTHSLHAKAFSVFGKPLDMITQDACAFYNDLGVYAEHKGIAFQLSEGEAMAKALGSKKAALLQNHGALVATSSIESTVYFFIQLDHCCQVQLLTDAASSATGHPKTTITDEQAAITRKDIGDEKYFGWYSGTMEFRLLESQEGKTFD